MSDVVIINYNVGEDGRIELQLPDDAPRGEVTIQIQKSSLQRPKVETTIIDEQLTDEDAELTELLRIAAAGGLGKTMGEILQDPAIGIWADRPEMDDSVEYVRQMRKQQLERRRKSD